MTLNKEIELINKLDKEGIDIMKNKAKDYANNIDVLSNFKRLSGVVRELNLSLTTPHGYALFMCLLKIDRINNLLSNNKIPNNESIDDSFIDAISYQKLAYLCYIEGQPKVKEETGCPFDEDLYKISKKEKLADSYIGIKFPAINSPSKNYGMIFRKDSNGYYTCYSQQGPPLSITEEQVKNDLKLGYLKECE